MSTRGIIGTPEYVVYNHMDSYPSKLGMKFADLVSRHRRNIPRASLIALSKRMGTTLPIQVWKTRSVHLGDYDWAYIADASDISVYKYGKLMTEAPVEVIRSELENLARRYEYRHGGNPMAKKRSGKILGMSTKNVIILAAVAAGGYYLWKKNQPVP